ncbi:MAG: hypothetical protein NVS2B4_16470 [Ramlibacter sp.]
MRLPLRVVLRRLVLLAALALGSCGGGSGDTGVADIGSGGTGAAGGSGVADIGSGGTGATGSGPGGIGVAGGGVGSGGTGATPAVGLGSIDGFGSIVVNGVHYEIGSATTVLSDASTLKLGMTVLVSGLLSADQTQGTATLVVSAADLRGSLSALSPATGTFNILGLQVSTDAATAYAGGLVGFGGLAQGKILQVHGLPAPGGQLHATRIEAVAATVQPVLTGYVQDLDRAAKTLRIGTQRVSYRSAGFPGDWPPDNLVNGVVVRVRAAAVATTLAATSVEPWNPTPLSDGARLSLGGLVSDYLGPKSLRIDGVPADLGAARISGSDDALLADGARVEASGTVRGGVLQVTRLKVRQPAPVAGSNDFSARGTVGKYRSPSDFEVQGQEIDAGNAVFVGGTAADLRSGRKVLVTGAQVRDDVLVADQVEFLP